ncbi:hypothetical protein [Actinomycetospora cinnamomea]|uniref:Uncharacterized protein n=1 Tax=Actinomycetospora cinnamomea TaxID=663609 RepID=A0A2U1FDE6_9PSEU|nr:hypothetical protein [Actinomycetospora cinnamomea]PVZ10156.1 hypothetical protein C8D89_105233 [Actinomycetospora cinnamomea]
MPTSLTEKPPTLSETLVVRFTEAEVERLRALADEHEVSMARVVRVAVADLFERMDEEAPAPTKKKRKK